MLLDIIETKKSAEIFLKPVDPIKDKISQYFTIIKKPMDLLTMRKKLHKNQYKNFDEFTKDIDLIVWNCMKFNAGND
jgi:bromodomain-containing factor 1